MYTEMLDSSTSLEEARVFKRTLRILKKQMLKLMKS